MVGVERFLSTGENAGSAVLLMINSEESDKNTSKGGKELFGENRVAISLLPSPRFVSLMAAAAAK